MVKKVLILTAIVAATVIFSSLLQPDITNNLQQNQARQKVKIDIFTQSLCPDCMAFIRGSFKNAVSTPDLWKICDVNFYPYGNARRNSNGSSWIFTCQHGVRECQGNLIEACALRKFDYYSQGLPFLVCIEEDTFDWTGQGQICANKYGMDWNIINSCAKGPQGNQIMYQMALATEKLNPIHNYVPWIVVNDRHSQSSENAVISNMVRYVCSIYTGSEKIDACNQ